MCHDECSTRLMVLIRMELLTAIVRCNRNLLEVYRARTHFEWYGKKKSKYSKRTTCNISTTMFRTIATVDREDERLHDGIPLLIVVKFSLRCRGGKVLRPLWSRPRLSYNYRVW